MKKGKIFLLSLLVLVFAGALAGCGREGEEETGSHTDPGNEFTENATEPSTDGGVVNDAITDAATEAKEIGSDLWDAATDAANDIKDGVQDLDDGVTRATE